jgi:hypothetical protein
VKAGLHGGSVEKREFLISANLPTYFAKKGNILGIISFSKRHHFFYRNQLHV